MVDVACDLGLQFEKKNRAKSNRKDPHALSVRGSLLKLLLSDSAARVGIFFFLTLLSSSVRSDSMTYHIKHVVHKVKFSKIIRHGSLNLLLRQHELMPH